MLENINSQVLKRVVLSEEELQLFNSLPEFKKLPKKTMLLHEGDICNFEAFINKGCIRLIILMNTVLRLIKNNDQWEAKGTLDDAAAKQLFDNFDFDMVLLSSGINRNCENDLCAHLKNKKPGDKDHPALWWR